MHWLRFGELVTLWNLVSKGYLYSEWSPHQITVFWLTDEGKEVMDQSMKIYGAVQ